MEIQLKNSTNLPKKTRLESVEGQNQQNILEDVHNLIQTLNRMRFIQKISRPMDKRIKQQYVQKFAGKMQMLHHKMSLIQKECTQNLASDFGNLNNAPKTRQSLQGSNTLKATDWRKTIRTIQSRYIEVFYQGSFKHYKRLMILNNFSYKLQTIDIHQWATSCLSSSENQSKCCCC